MLQDLIIQYPLFFYTLVLVSSILSASLGIGSFILIPITAIFFGAKESIGIITLYFLCQNISKIVVFRGHANVPIAKKIILWAIPGVLIGATLLAFIPSTLFEKLLAGSIILFIIHDVIKMKSPKNSGEKSIPLFGLLYGFFSGVLGSGNLVKGPLFVSMGLLKETYIATYAITSLFMNIPKIGIYAFSGIITLQTLYQSVPFVFISILGTVTGKKVLKHISNRFFYVVMMAFFLLTALLLFF